MQSQQRTSVNLIFTKSTQVGPSPLRGQGNLKVFEVGGVDQLCPMSAVRQHRWLLQSGGAFCPDLH